MSRQLGELPEYVYFIEVTGDSKYYGEYKRYYGPYSTTASARSALTRETRYGFHPEMSGRILRANPEWLEWTP